MVIVHSYVSHFQRVTMATLPQKESENLRPANLCNDKGL